MGWNRHGLLVGLALLALGCRTTETVATADEPNLLDQSGLAMGALDLQRDFVTERRASQILPAGLHAGPHHRVDEVVVLYGPQHRFWVHSDFGSFEAQGDARLRRLVREIQAIGALREATRTESYARAFQHSLASPFRAAKGLLLHPPSTLSGIPGGVETFVLASLEETRGGRSQYEDDMLAALVTVSKYKRRWAGELEIDVYSENPALQQELNRLGWVAALGNWTPSLVLMPLQGPGKVAWNALSWTDSFNRLMVEEAPDNLRVWNRERLENMGVEAEIVDRFLHHRFLSPRHTTAIVQALDAMAEASGRPRAIELALVASSEVSAFYHQRIVEILSSYHERVSPLVDLVEFRGLPLGLARDGTLVFAFPADYGQWTPFAQTLFRGFAGFEPPGRQITARALQITGALTPQARRELAALGIAATEDLAREIAFVD